MGVYIKGMNKPESCAQCPGYDNEWGRCGFTRKEVTIFKMDMNDCPLQPIDDEMVEKTQLELECAWLVFQSVIKDEKQ